MATSSGYDCDFLSEPDNSLRCLICLAIARDPRQHEECGKLFCSECIEKYGTDKPCPNCKKTGAHFYKDHRSKRSIAELEVKCDHNAKRRCTWVGTVGTLEEHVTTCEFTLLSCPKECKDDSDKVKQFMRKDFDKHLEEDCPNRDYNCEHCGEKGMYASITDIHDKKCRKKPVPCPNGCGSVMERQHVSKHLATECELTVIACKYKRLGCDRELKRKDMAAHEEDDKLHLRMAMDTTVKLKEQDALKVLKLKITNYQEKKENSDSVESPSYYTSPNGYRMALDVEVNGEGDAEGTHVSVFAPILKGKFDDDLKWPLIGKITFTLLNQLEDKNHHQDILELTAKHNAEPGETVWGYLKFFPHSALDYDAVNNTQYLKDDTLYFRMSVEPADHKPWLQ